MGLSPTSDCYSIAAVNPVTGAELTKIVACCPTDMDVAVDKAREAF